LKEPTIVIVVGPTASGKTAAAIRLAEKLQTRIISADSRQCFRELNIGVAKPTPAELATVHHYFINSHSISEEVNAAIFEDLALQWAEEIFEGQRSAGKPPLAVMTGGTGLYIQAFERGLDEIPSSDPEIRESIQQEYERSGLAWLQREVQSRDPAYYAAGENQNPQRLMRALEVRLSTGRSILSFHSSGKKDRPFQVLRLGLELPREELYRRINLRTDRMMEEGLLEEVKGLKPFRAHNALQTVGYRELFDHLDGNIELDEAVAQIKTHTRQYAKRQLTWFRKDAATRWFHPDAPTGEFLEILK
jgi:tRNA dimethylallyltransferase